MTRWFAALLPALGACIIYDHDGKDWDVEQGPDARPDEGGLGADSGVDEDTGEVAAYKFVLDPATANPSDTFIAHLTQTGNFDLSQVVGAEFLDDGAEVLASESGADEVLLTISVAHDAAPGLRSLLLHTADGGNEYVPDVLTVLESNGQNTGGDDSGDCP